MLSGATDNWTGTCVLVDNGLASFGSFGSGQCRRKAEQKLIIWKEHLIAGQNLYSGLEVYYLRNLFRSIASSKHSDSYCYFTCTTCSFCYNMKVMCIL